jgi:hypothetical protein
MKTLSQYKKKLDEHFSKYIRYRDEGQCFTCPKKDHPKKMQCGHFNPRQYLATRWDETNNNCQCYACNMLYGGNPATYSVRLIEKYGLEHVRKLESLRWTPVKLTPMWYEEKIAYYQNKLNEMGVE